jgi:prevent-host-death family protein
MTRVGVRELRQNLSRYLRLVGQGETLEVTERGQPVALLTPLPATTGGVYGRLATAGRLVRGPRASGPLPPVPAAPAGARPLSEALDELRGER